MPVTDPIADMLTRIRNAITAKHSQVTIPSSRMKKAICLILKEEGFIKNYKIIQENNYPNICLYLKYEDKKNNVIQGLERISKPGCRIYKNSKNIPRVINGLGIAILSTNQGIITDKVCRKRKIGGELLCYVW